MLRTQAWGAPSCTHFVHSNWESLDSTESKSHTQNLATLSKIRNIHMKPIHINNSAPQRAIMNLNKSLGPSLSYMLE